MDDFIDKVRLGPEPVFSNGVGYPRTRWLVLDGAKDETAFKHYLRSHQVADAGLVLGLRPAHGRVNIDANSAAARGPARARGARRPRRGWSGCDERRSSSTTSRACRPRLRQPAVRGVPAAASRRGRAGAPCGGWAGELTHGLAGGRTSARVNLALTATGIAA